MTINFTLKDIKSAIPGKEYLIYLRYDHSGRKFMASTHEYAEINQLNFITRRGRRKIDPARPVNRKKAGYLGVNERLQLSYNEMSDAVTMAKKENDVSVDNVKRQYMQLIEPSELVSKDLYLTDAVQKIIDDKSSQWSPNTVKNYKSLKSNLEDFDHYSISQIDQNFFDDWFQYLSDKYSSGGSIDNQIKLFKSVCSKLLKKKYPVNPDFEEMKRLRQEPKIVYLYDDELRRIEEVHLATESLQRQRDVFLVQCYVGVRVSDLWKVNRDNIDFSGNKLMIRLSQKTKKAMAIPIMDKCMEILRKYDYQLPLISSVNYRIAIKDIAREAGLNRRLDEFGGIALHEKISTHTAKRTFTKLMFNKGLDISDISRITGTSKETLLRHYAGESRDEEILAKVNS